MWDGDYGGDWIVATYDSEVLALADVAGRGGDGNYRIEAVEVLSVLDPEATPNYTRLT